MSPRPEVGTRGVSSPRHIPSVAAYCRAARPGTWELCFPAALSATSLGIPSWQDRAAQACSRMPSPASGGRGGQKCHQSGLHTLGEARRGLRERTGKLHTSACSARSTNTSGWYMWPAEDTSSSASNTIRYYHHVVHCLMGAANLGRVLQLGGSQLTIRWNS